MEVRAFAGQAPDATVYVVSELPDGSIQVRFGDGINGARLPLGVGNVIATYRYGSPAPSPPASQLSTVLQPQPNLGTVSQPGRHHPGHGPGVGRADRRSRAGHGGAAQCDGLRCPAADLPG